MANRYFPYDSDNASDFLNQLRRAPNKEAALKDAFANVPRDVKAMSGILPAQWEQAIVSAELLAARKQPSPHFKRPSSIDVHALTADEAMFQTARETVTWLLRHAPLPEYTGREVWDAHEAGWNELLVRLGGQALPTRALPGVRMRWALQDLAHGALHEDLLACAPPPKSASEGDEDALLRLLQTMQGMRRRTPRSRCQPS